MSEVGQVEPQTLPNHWRYLNDADNKRHRNAVRAIEPGDTADGLMTWHKQTLDPRSQGPDGVRAAQVQASLGQRPRLDVQSDV